MSLLAALTVKVSAILLLALVGVLCLRMRSAAARHWVLAIGVVSACVAPALHVLPIPPVVQVAPVGPLAWSAGPVFDALGLHPYIPFTEPEDANQSGLAVGSEPARSQPGRFGPAAAAVTTGDAIGRWAVTIWLAGVVASAGVLLVGLARLRWLRVSSLVVGKPGFERLFQRFSLEGGEQIEEELVLRLGSVEETITVTDTGESPTAARTISEATRARYLEHRNQGGTIAPPIKIRDLAPVYPASVRGSGFEGKVVLEAQIKTDGTVEVLRILAPVDPATMTTVYPDLARSAVEAVGGWRYEPTLLHGVPVDTRMTINVTFRR